MYKVWHESLLMRYYRCTHFLPFWHIWVSLAKNIYLSHKRMYYTHIRVKEDTRMCSLLVFPIFIFLLVCVWWGAGGNCMCWCVPYFLPSFCVCVWGGGAVCVMDIWMDSLYRQYLPTSLITSKAKSVWVGKEASMARYNKTLITGKLIATQGVKRPNIIQL